MNQQAFLFVWFFLINVHKPFLFSTGVKCEQLTQPASLTVRPGQRLTITCQVSYSVSSYWTHWIRQPAGKGLEWIGEERVGYTTYYKDSLKTKFSISTDSSSNTVTLTGQNVQPEDTAVYYCAREPHTVTQNINRPEQELCSASVVVNQQRRSFWTIVVFKCHF
uniref:Ig-like domain-containing protein n=1 Tax=Pundamilia nyererei TaxID=303518 RepID=A0A3B4HBH7_9CICH